MSVSRAEVCAVACAELFRDAGGEIMVSPMATMVSIGARLARLTFSPDILLTDGEARLLADTPALGAAGASRDGCRSAGCSRRWPGGAGAMSSWAPTRSTATVTRTCRRSGRCSNRPGRCSACAVPPGNTINHATSYWVGNHSKRVFGDSVDVVSGIGWDKVDPANPAYRFVNVYRVVTNLGVFDFNGPDHQMRAVSLHPGVEAEQVAENTSFEVHGLESAEQTRLPTEAEQKLIRDVIDPKGLRDKEIR